MKLIILFLCSMMAFGAIAQIDSSHVVFWNGLLKEVEEFGRAKISCHEQFLDPNSVTPPRFFYSETSNCGGSNSVDGRLLDGLDLIFTTKDNASTKKNSAFGTMPNRPMVDFKFNKDSMMKVFPNLNNNSSLSTNVFVPFNKVEYVPVPVAKNERCGCCSDPAQTKIADQVVYYCEGEIRYIPENGGTPVIKRLSKGDYLEFVKNNEKILSNQGSAKVGLCLLFNQASATTTKLYTQGKHQVDFCFIGSPLRTEEGCVGIAKNVLPMNKCDDPLVWDNDRKKCVCVDADQIYEGGKCLYLCPDGTKVDAKKKCLQTEKIICPTGQILVDNICQCALPNQVYDGERCRYRCEDGRFVDDLKFCTPPVRPTMPVGCSCTGISEGESIVCYDYEESGKHYTRLWKCEGNSLKGIDGYPLLDCSTYSLELLINGEYQAVDCCQPPNGYRGTLIGDACATITIQQDRIGINGVQTGMSGARFKVKKK